MSMFGIWYGFGLQAIIKLVYGGHYNAPEVDSAARAVLEALGSAIVLTLMSALFDQLAYFCESYFCNIPVLRVWETCDLREKFYIPITVTLALGTTYITAPLISPLASMSLETRRTLGLLTAVTGVTILWIAL